MTKMMVMIRVRPVMITIIVASCALPTVSNVTIEMQIRTRRDDDDHHGYDEKTLCIANGV